MKMMLKRFFIFLVAAISAFVEFPEAWALRPKDDLFVHVLNSTMRPLEICNSDLTFCEKVLPGKTITDAQATEQKAAEYFRFWLTHSVAKVCGKTVPLENVILSPTVEKQAGEKLTYRLIISEESYARECK